MILSLKKLLFIFLGLLLTQAVYAQPMLQLTTGRLSLQPVATLKEGLFWDEQQEFEGKKYLVVQFSRPPDSLQTAKLELAGIHLQNFLPPNGYTAVFDKNLSKPQLQSLGLSSISSLPASLRISPLLQQPERYRWLNGNAGTIHVLVKIAGKLAASLAKQYLLQKGFTAVESPLENFGILEGAVNASELYKLAATPFVEFIEPAHPEDQTLNDETRMMARVNAASAPLAQGGYGLSGAGVTVGVGDDADPTNHIDLRDRIINRSAFVYNTHGTHVSGTIAGAGIYRYLSRGYAPAATIVSQLFGSIFLNAGTYISDFGMVATNNSYGSITRDSTYEGYYDLYSQVLDQQAFFYPGLLHVFASGNDGEVTVGNYTPNYSNVLSSYQSAKNVITTGRTDRTMYASGSSSSGPVRDGRLKPEMMALGEELISCAGNGLYASEWGTSMAAPAITGGIALMTEQYRRQYSANPKGGLIKNLLMNGALDVGKPGPDFRHGYGTLNLERSLDILKNNRFYQASISTGGLQSQSITVPANVAELRVMLYWHDPAAAIYATKTLVNDLDLEVTDAAGTTNLPQKLDTLPSNVSNIATTGADHINNSEQVIVRNPSGAYTIRVKGTAINVNPSQEYFITYDFLARGLHLSVPFAKDAYWPGDLCVIHWSDNGTPANQRTLEYNLDDGAGWQLISNNISDTARYYMWTVPAGETTTARVRITENNTAFTDLSGAFTILASPGLAFAPPAEQCEGYCKINWNSISTNTGIDYEVLMKQGPDMVSMGSTTTNTFTIKGLNKDSVYWFALRARKGGIEGKRTDGNPYQPSGGSCAGTISDADLKVDSILTPNTGRVFSSSALTASTPINIRIKNLDDAPLSNFTISYSVNGGAFITQSPTATIAAGGSYVHTFTGSNFSQPGIYNLLAIVKKAGDGNATNDTLRKIVKQLKNPALSLATAFIENFDGAPAQEHSGSVTGLDSLDSWDLNSATSSGRVRTFVNSGISRTGTRALTIDVNKFTASGSSNFVTGTFNLASYNAATDEVRFNIWFKQHGSYQETNPENKIYVRGSETGSWLPVYDLSANQPANPGEWKNTGSIDLAAALKDASPPQPFSATTQIRFGQNSMLGMGDNTHYGGYTFDDLRLYTVSNDVEAIAITSPNPNSCGLTTNTPVTILLKNAMNNGLANVPVSFQVDGGGIITEVLPLLAPSAAGTPFTFTATANLSALGNHTLKVWAQLAADSYHANDTITIIINNKPVITSFPYLEDFETGTGDMYSSGLNNSWQHGEPLGFRIKTAASGTKVWKTNLQGAYNDEELSYLYTPCFNVSALQHPTLSFSMAYQLEYCRDANDPSFYCDGAWVEYSADGISWNRLQGGSGAVNWYNNASGSLWDSTKSYWHVATASLPAGLASLRLRFVMKSDIFTGLDGVAIDDIHIYDKTYEIFDGPANSNTITTTVAGSGAVDFTDAGQLIASIYPNGSNLGTTAVKTYLYAGTLRNNGQQYYADRNITIQPSTNNPQFPVKLRFYFLDKEAEAMRLATGCNTCVAPTDYTQLGILKYTDADRAKENGTMADNLSGIQTRLNGFLVRKVPYGKGYYADYLVNNFSEFWLTDGNTGSVIIATNWQSFTAEKLVNNDVKLTWKMASEANVIQYEVEVSKNNGGNTFERIAILPARNGGNVSEYTFTDQSQNKTGAWYYRIKRVDGSGRVLYSDTKLLIFGKTGPGLIVYPNPVKDQLNLLFQAVAGSKVAIKLLDAAGKLILQSETSATGNAQKIQLQVGALAAGVYHLQLLANDQSETVKIIK